MLLVTDRLFVKLFSIAPLCDTPVAADLCRIPHLMALGTETGSMKMGRPTPAAASHAAWMDGTLRLASTTINEARCTGLRPDAEVVLPMRSWLLT